MRRLLKDINNVSSIRAGQVEKFSPQFQGSLMNICNRLYLSVCSIYSVSLSHLHAWSHFYSTSLASLLRR